MTSPVPLAPDQARHVHNTLTHALAAATRIGHALALTRQDTVGEALVDALQSSLVVVEEARQALKQDLAARRQAAAVEDDER